MKTAIDMLREAKALLVSGGICRGVYDAIEGRMPGAPLTQSHCSVGALRAVRPDYTVAANYTYEVALSYLARGAGSMNIPTFNDRSTDAEILAAFDRAIELAASESRQ